MYVKSKWNWSEKTTDKVNLVWKTHDGYFLQSVKFVNCMWNRKYWAYVHVKKEWKRRETVSERVNALKFSLNLIKLPHKQENPKEN